MPSENSIIGATICSYCCIILVILLMIIGFLLGGTYMLVVGSVCLRQNEFDDCNGNESNAIIMVVFGCIMILCAIVCCCGGCKVTVNRKG